LSSHNLGNKLGSGEALMVTQLKSDTARANGAKSRGPKTASSNAKPMTTSGRYTTTRWKSTNPPPPPKKPWSTRWSPPAGVCAASRPSKAAFSTPNNSTSAIEGLHHASQLVPCDGSGLALRIPPPPHVPQFVQSPPQLQAARAKHVLEAEP